MTRDGDFPWGCFPVERDLLNFIIEKAKNVKSPMLKGELATEFATIHEGGCPERISFYVGRIAAFCGELNKMETFDNVAKIKLMFLLGVSCNKRLLQIVRMNAHVEVDRRNRITKYRANDGSVNFEGEHTQSKNQTNGTGTKEIPPESTKRPAEGVPNCQSKRPRIDFWGPGADYPSSGFFEHLNQDHAPFESYPLIGSVDILSHPVVEEPPNQRIQEFREPKREMESREAPEAPETTVIQTEAVGRAPEALAPAPGAPEALAPALEPSRPQYGPNDAYTPQIKFLEAIKSLVISLDTPTLSRILSKIEQKICEIGQSNHGIPNDEMIPVMDLMVARISNNSESNLPDTVESVSFKEFLCYLKCVILSLKLEGLEVLLEKIKEKNKEVAMKDKKVPVEKVAMILQYALDFI